MLNLEKLETILKKAGIEYNINNLGSEIVVDYANKTGAKISKFFDGAVDGLHQIMQSKVVGADNKASNKVFTIHPFSPKVLGVTEDRYLGGKLKRFSVAAVSYKNEAIYGGKPVEINRTTTKFVKSGPVQSKLHIDFSNCGTKLGF